MLMSSGGKRSTTSIKLIAASDLDRVNVEKAGIEHLVVFLGGGTHSQLTLKNGFPLIGVAFSDEAEADLKGALVLLRHLATVPEVPSSGSTRETGPR